MLDEVSTIFKHGPCFCLTQVGSNIVCFVDGWRPVLLQSLETVCFLYPDGIPKMQLLCDSTSTWNFRTFIDFHCTVVGSVLPIWQKGSCCPLGGIMLWSWLFIAWFSNWLLTSCLVITWFTKRPYFSVPTDYNYKLVFELRNRPIMFVTANIKRKEKTLW